MIHDCRFVIVDEMVGDCLLSVSENPCAHSSECRFSPHDLHLMSFSQRKGIINGVEGALGAVWLLGLCFEVCK